MTGQVDLDSYIDAGAIVAVDLINAFASERNTTDSPQAEVIEKILAVDPASVARLTGADVPGFIELAQRLRQIFQLLHREDVDEAAAILNAMLTAHPAFPHLAKDEGLWRLHHHPSDTELVPEWNSICAENLARLIGAGYENRFGICSAPECDRVFIDLSKNRSRRFCSIACQNRAKAAAYRQRQSTRPSV
jgi:predicted RNA-binding Zn ribbon-like protein